MRLRLRFLLRRFRRGKSPGPVVGYAEQRGFPAIAGDALSSAGFRPPLFFARAKKSRRRSGGKETRFMLFRLRRKTRPGVSSDTAVEIRQSSAGCAVHRYLPKACRRKGRHWALAVVRDRKACSPTPARYAHTWVDEGGSRKRLPDYYYPAARSEAERAGPTRRHLAIFHPDDRPSHNLRRQVSDVYQNIAHPAGDFRSWSAGSEETPGLTFAQQRSRLAFFFSTVHGDFSFDASKEKWGCKAAAFIALSGHRRNSFVFHVKHPAGGSPFGDFFDKLPALFAVFSCNCFPLLL